MQTGHPRNGIYLQTFQKFEIKRYIRNGVVLGTFRLSPVRTNLSESVGQRLQPAPGGRLVLAVPGGWQPAGKK